MYKTPENQQIFENTPQTSKGKQSLQNTNQIQLQITKKKYHNNQTAVHNSLLHYK